jgi:ribosomal subunit interface protein
MKIQTKATQITLTPDVENYLQKKLAAVEKYVQGREEALVAAELGRMSEHHKSGNVFRAELTLYIKHGTFRAVAEAADLYAAIDEAKDELVKELKSHRSKRRDIVRKSALKLKNLLKGLTGRRDRSL